MSEKFILSGADYGIVTLLLTVSAVIGLYFSIFGGKQKTNDEYLLAGKDMPILPVSFSFMASFLSATTILGIPAEMYLFGTNMTFMNLGFTLGPIISSYFFLPIYFKTGITTSFEYLERRFGKTTRTILHIIFFLNQILFSGVSLYAPALALSAVTDLSLWTSVICLGVFCTFYSTIGGMKAVIWSDVFQALLMYICLFAVIIKGCLDLGGVQPIFKKAYDGGRILLPTFKMDFSERYTMWSVLLQGVIITTASYGGSQVEVQRQLTLRNLKRSQIATLLSIPVLVVFQLLCCFCGFIFYVYFQFCDPVSSLDHPIESYDQLMPYYITSAMSECPGLPGLCITGVFSASLSTISSSVNSMACVTYEDIIRPLWPSFKKPVLISKIASILYGAVTILVTFLIATMGNLTKTSVLICGILSGPWLGVLLLASLTTTANEMGVNIGVLAGFLLAGIMTFAPNERQYPILPIQHDCSEDNLTADNSFSLINNIHASTDFTNFSVTEVTPSPDLPDDFPISFMWISPLSLLVCVVTGYIGSWIIFCIRGKSKFVHPELLSPIRQRFYLNNRHVHKCSANEKFLEDTTESNL